MFEDSGIYIPTGNFRDMGGGTGGAVTTANGQYQSIVIGPFDSGTFKLGTNNDF